MAAPNIPSPGSTCLLYQPLNPLKSEIRILNIAPDELGKPICGSVECVSLNHLPQFIALSYYWGDPNDCRPILLDNYTFGATANLYHALLQLRSKGVLRLWVDAICINQADRGEKSSQIQLMGSIYERAQAVVAWVGLEDATGNDAALMARLSYDVSPTFQSVPSLPSQLSLFLQRDYWTRVWIIQELALARQLTIHCGPHQLDWAKFQRAVTSVSKHSEQLTPTEISLYRMVENIIQIRYNIREQEESQPIPLLPALYKTWMAKSSDPLDKIYGILGLTTDGARYISAPNYSFTVEQLCQELTLSAIARTRNLDIIPFLGRGFDDPSVASKESASWIPRWHALDGANLKRQLEFLISNMQPSSGSQVFHRPLCAAGKSTAWPNQEHNILTCEGTQVGYIQGVSRSLLQDESSQLEGLTCTDQAINPYEDERHTFLAIFDSFCWKSGASRKAPGFLASLLEHRRNPKPFSAPRYDRAYLPEFLRIWRCSYQAGFSPKVQGWIDDHRSFVIHGRTLGDWAKWMSWTQEGILRRVAAAQGRHYGQLFDVAQHIVPELAYMIENGMRLMVTDKGHVGWTHPKGRPGDALYILKGCHVPVVLRSRAEGGFFVVGDAYIQGLMAGEAVEAATDESWVNVQLH